MQPTSTTLIEYGSYHEVEARINKALQALSEDPQLKVADAAYRFWVPYQRLLARHNGRISRSGRASTNLRLDKLQQQALEAYIHRCDSLGVSVLSSQLIHAAQTILDRNLQPGEKLTPLGQLWASRYLKRNPHLRRIKQKPKELNCTAIDELPIYQQHFRHFKELIAERDILSEDIYNMDEIGFCIGVGGN